MSNRIALLVIDAQTGVVDWASADANGEAVLANINRLLAEARRDGVPVIYVQDDDIDFPVGSPEWQINPAIAPHEGELVVHKRACDSFYETELADVLSARGITHLVVTGCRSQYCVDTTCRSAVARGYPVTLVSDAHTTMENGVLTAKQIVAHTNRTLWGFGNAKAEITVLPTEEVRLLQVEKASAE
jgi:nicotinamidase-related amidase